MKAALPDELELIYPEIERQEEAQRLARQAPT